MDGFDKVVAKVIITRPTVGAGNLLMKAGLGLPTIVNGDSIDARTAKLLELAKEQGGLGPTITQTYPLFDDGTNGDRFANNEYWSAQLPKLALVEGEYKYRFVFTITENGKTFQREATHTVSVEVKIDPEATIPEIEDLGVGQDGRQRTRFKIVPQDALGNFIGPGRPGAFEIVTTGDALIEKGREGEDGVVDDGRGGYEVIASWLEGEEEPTLILKQNGKVRQTLILPTLKLILGMPDINVHFDEDIIDRPPVVPPTVNRDVSNTTPAPGELVRISMSPSDFDIYRYTTVEDIGGLVYTGENTADENPEGTTFVMLKPAEFHY
ncbi:MAG: hypothetical protein IIC20_03150, partial [Chloroflexi bacterium]|nr:hypothetical protein [Chloroflexota bacterium]